MAALYKEPPFYLGQRYERGIAVLGDGVFVAQRSNLMLDVCIWESFRLMKAGLAMRILVFATLLLFSVSLVSCGVSDEGGA